MPIPTRCKQLQDYTIDVGTIQYKLSAPMKMGQVKTYIYILDKFNDIYSFLSQINFMRFLWHFQKWFWIKYA